MTPAELKVRTERLADAIVALCAPLLDMPRARALADQLLRSGTALDANYGSAQRARSNREFVSKLGQALDDASESLGWLRRLSGLKPPVSPQLPTLLHEAD